MTADRLAIGLIRRTFDMSLLIGSALDRAEVEGDWAAHRNLGRRIRALQDALVSEVFPTILELDRQPVPPRADALTEAMRRRGILLGSEDWRAALETCSRAGRDRAPPVEMEDAAEHLVLVEARARGWIAERLSVGLTG